VNLQVFGSSENLTTARKRAGERLLASVHTNMIDELVLGLERLKLTRAVLPVASVLSLRAIASHGAIGPADVLHRQMGHDVVHVVEGPVAKATCLLVDPFAGEFLLYGRCAQVAEECACWGIATAYVVVCIVC
jgi:hypothetical protein